MVKNWNYFEVTGKVRIRCWWITLGGGRLQTISEWGRLLNKCSLTFAVISSITEPSFVISRVGV